MFECANSATASPNKGYVATDCADQITVQSWYDQRTVPNIAGRLSLVRSAKMPT